MSGISPPLCVTKTPQIETFHVLTHHLRTVVGVDFGTLNTVIAVARNRGVDVVSSLRLLKQVQ